MTPKKGYFSLPPPPTTFFLLVKSSDQWWQSSCFLAALSTVSFVWVVGLRQFFFVGVLGFGFVAFVFRFAFCNVSCSSSWRFWEAISGSP